MSSLSADSAPARPHVLIAPDKFKGSATAQQVATALGEGIRAVVPAARITTLPIADGGEGTLDAVVPAGSDRRRADVTGPLGETRRADWGIRVVDGRRVAVIESAAASGLEFVTPTPDAAVRATSAGTGDLIRAALDEGVDEIVVTLGGSAMSDGGAGALRALGARLLDAEGRAVADGALGLERVDALDLSGCDARLSEVSLRLAVDVDNPLVGERGAAAVFSPQKGADTVTVTRIDA
ncbi:MAG: glycerate kinase, partial [Mycetocola sp.]